MSIKHFTASSTKTLHSNDESISVAKQKVENLITLTEQLTGIFVEENQHLQARDINEFHNLQTEKQKLTSAYALAIRDVAQNRTTVKEAGGNLLSALRKTTATFNNKVSDQQALLEGVHRVGSNMVSAITKNAIDATTGHSGTSTGYGKSGTKTRNANAVVVNINENA